MKKPEEASREEIAGLFHDKPTDPSKLEWKPLMGFMKNTLRLQMGITKENASLPLTDACRTYVYPEEDVLEIKGLLRALEAACEKAGVGYRLVKGPRELYQGFVASFQPWKIVLPFKKARLVLAIGPGEFQWILENAKKERGPLSDKLERLKRELLAETKEWLKRGNR